MVIKGLYSILHIHQDQKAVILYDFMVFLVFLFSPFLFLFFVFVFIEEWKCTKYHHLWCNALLQFILKHFETFIFQSLSVWCEDLNRIRIFSTYFQIALAGGSSGLFCFKFYSSSLALSLLQKFHIFIFFSKITWLIGMQVSSNQPPQHF